MSDDYKWPLLRLRRVRWGRVGHGVNLDIGRSGRPFRLSLWRSIKPSYGVERRRQVHQVRVHFGRRHLTFGRFVWRHR